MKSIIKLTIYSAPTGVLVLYDIVTEKKNGNEIETKKFSLYTPIIFKYQTFLELAVLFCILPLILTTTWL